MAFYKTTCVWYADCVECISLRSLQKQETNTLTDLSLITISDFAWILFIFEILRTSFLYVFLVRMTELGENRGLLLSRGGVNACEF